MAPKNETTRRRPRLRRPTVQEKRPYFLTMIIGDTVYRNLYHESVSFAVDTPMNAPEGCYVAELNLFLEKEVFEALRGNTLNDVYTPETPGCICLANNTQYGFRGLPRVIAYEETKGEGIEGVLVKLKYNVTELKYIKG